MFIGARESEYTGNMAALLNTRANCFHLSLSRNTKTVIRLCSESNEAVEQRYSNSVLLPKTKFPTWIKGDKRVEKDHYLIEKCGFAELYTWQRENLQGPDFILHDGPPYANGVPHMGHAINKILKDITIRSRVIRGQRVQYVPGWDCHGLPIELKALTTLKEDKTQLTPLQVRQLARKYAKKAVEKQREVFVSWGVMADWKESGCYLTNETSYVTNQLRRFNDLYEKKLVFRAFKPVYWSPSCRTALAESELEYKNHTSKCAIVRFRVRDLPAALKQFDDRRVYGLTWTTTPWTLVANQALAYSNDTVYSIAEDEQRNLNIVAKDLFDSVAEKIGRLKHVLDIKGSELAGARYSQPITSISLPFLPANHVKTTVGTGLVHTAPAHGSEDFLVGLENKITVLCLVNKDGRYTPDAGENFAGLEVLTEGTEAVIKFMGDDVLQTEYLQHTYPYDWRTKKPVLTLASHQWFIDTDSLKEKAIESLENVQIYPKTQQSSSAKVLYNQIKQRPYWCISRQRAWGTPIPVLYRKDTGDVVTSREFVERLCSLVGQNGCDFWWTMSVEELVGERLLEEMGIEASQLEKGQDIMDIWLDSGLSWSAVLPEGKADLYIEGMDQFTGWFQSSLLTSIALRGIPPFKSLFVHGFAVDEKDDKMSKSVGNVVNPEDITKGGKDQKKKPAYGVNTLRWWVASHGCQHSQVPVSDTLIRGSAESVQKLRLVLRFLLGALYRYDMYNNVQGQYLHLDKCMLHRLLHYNNQIQGFYDAYQYHHVCKAALNFVTNDVSAIYCHLVKDRLYCDAALSPYRIGVVDVIGEILAVIVRSLAPIIPHLAEEVWLYHPDNLASVPLHHSAHVLPHDWHDPHVEAVINTALIIRNELQKQTKSNSWASNATVTADNEKYSTLSILQPEKTSSNSELCEILQVSTLTLINDPSSTSTRIDLKPTETALCKRCRRYPESETGVPCHRCTQYLNALSS